MIVDGKVETFHAGKWHPVELSKIERKDGTPVVTVADKPIPSPMSIAQAIEEGRAAWRWELQNAGRLGSKVRPIRIVDMDGRLVEQWGKTNV